MAQDNLLESDHLGPRANRANVKEGMPKGLAVRLPQVGRPVRVKLGVFPVAYHIFVKKWLARGKAGHDEIRFAGSSIGERDDRLVVRGAFNASRAAIGRARR